MKDADRVAAIDRAAELALLPRLLEEATRPVPPAPPRPRNDPALRRHLVQVMQLLATTYPPGNRKADPRRPVDNIATIHPLSTARFTNNRTPNPRSPQAISGSISI